VPDVDATRASKGACSRYPVLERRINEGPDTFLEEPRAFYKLARVKARLPCLYASDARLCPVLRAGSMQASEKTYRFYSCARCVEQVRICGKCDRGNRYCAGGCAKIRRRESLHRAGERYQLSYRGASRHAARQSAWRQRQAQKVTHQGSLPSAAPAIVAAIPIPTTPEGPHADIASIQPPPQPYRMAPGAPSCSFCRRALPAFVRFGALRGGP
jgi:hypothetical protein